MPQEDSMRALHSTILASLALAAAAATPAWADSKAAAPLARFSGAIGVDPLTAAGGVDTLNVVRGINPGGRAWVLRRLSAQVGADGSVRASGRGLLFSSGDLIGTRGAVAAVAATLTCGPADATARKFTSPGVPLDAAGNFSIRGQLSEDGINPAVMPPTCDNPVLLIRAFNTTTGVAGGWFAAGIPGNSDDD
jgi:hypothetical protein